MLEHGVEQVYNRALEVLLEGGSERLRLGVLSVVSDRLKNFFDFVVNFLKLLKVRVRVRVLLDNSADQTLLNSNFGSVDLFLHAQETVQLGQLGVDGSLDMVVKAKRLVEHNSVVVSTQLSS